MRMCWIIFLMVKYPIVEYRFRLRHTIKRNSRKHIFIVVIVLFCYSLNICNVSFYFSSWLSTDYANRSKMFTLNVIFVVSVLMHMCCLNMSTKCVKLIDGPNKRENEKPRKLNFYITFLAALTHIKQQKERKNMTIF